MIDLTIENQMVFRSVTYVLKVGNWSKFPRPQYNQVGCELVAIRPNQLAGRHPKALMNFYLNYFILWIGKTFLRTKMKKIMSYSIMFC